MTTDNHCNMCRQQLKKAGNSNLYHSHESYIECLMALAKRVEQLEKTQRVEAMVESHMR